MAAFSPDTAAHDTRCTCCGYTMTVGSTVYPGTVCGYCSRNCKGGVCRSPKSSTLDPTWTPQVGYSHAATLTVKAAK